jgi:hypothetical protein
MEKAIAQYKIYWKYADVIHIVLHMYFQIVFFCKFLDTCFSSYFGTVTGKIPKLCCGWSDPHGDDTETAGTIQIFLCYCFCCWVPHQF